MVRERRVDPRKNWYRDFLLLVGLVLMLVALLVASEANSTAHRAITRVQEGRATSISITCAMISAVSQAGQTVIQGTAKHGDHNRRIRARRAAQEYAREINYRVSRGLVQLGRPVPKGLLRANGTLNCKVLQEVSAVAIPR